MARKFFDHEQFNFEFECALGGVHYGAGDIGEMMATADRVVDGDADSWCGERIATAERVGTIAEKSAKSGNEVSARTAYLRAATYYAMALPGWTKLSPTLDRAFARSRDCSDDLRLRVPGDRVVNAPTHGWVDLERLQVGESTHCAALVSVSSGRGSPEIGRACKRTENSCRTSPSSYAMTWEGSL
jgi:hypothetical protein